jgi:hypothetical protein
MKGRIKLPSHNRHSAEDPRRRYVAIQHVPAPDSRSLAGEGLNRFAAQVKYSSRVRVQAAFRTRTVSA